MWEELGVTRKFKFHFHDRITQIEGMGHKLLMTTDREQLESDLLTISPEDSNLIREFTRLIFGPDLMKAASLKPKELKNFKDSMREFFAILPLLRTFGKYGNMTLQQFAEKFQHPFLRNAIRFFLDTPGWPMVQFPMIPLAGFVKSGITEAGAPLGGSQQVVFHMADLFKELGGEIQYRCKVKELIIKDNRTAGVVLDDGSVRQADTVIWAGDGHSLIYDILEGKYINDQLRTMYEKWIPVKSIVHVMMGVNMDLSPHPHSMIFEAEEPISIAGQDYRWLNMLHHCFDPSMAPEGKSAVEVWYASDYEYWETLYRDKSAYKAEKNRIAGYTIGELDKRFPGFTSQVEVIDVPTPATYHRYTGNWKGSPDGWYVTPDNMRVQEPVRSLPGLEGLKMAGQWTAPFTGTVLAALSGRQVIQLMCREEGKAFRKEMAP
jgi:phytoene dehydrogenase-like protein